MTILVSLDPQAGQRVRFCVTKGYVSTLSCLVYFVLSGRTPKLAGGALDARWRHRAGQPDRPRWLGAAAHGAAARADASSA